MLQCQVFLCSNYTLHCWQSHAEASIVAALWHSFAPRGKDFNLKQYSSMSATIEESQRCILPFEILLDIWHLIVSIYSVQSAAIGCINEIEKCPLTQ
jgi:hypothetical protein